MRNAINKIMSNSLKNKEYPSSNSFQSTPVFKSDKEYQGSFTEIKKLAAKYTDKQKQSIDFIIFNQSNADGITSAYIVLRYLKKKLKRDLTQDDIFLMAARASSGRNSGVAKDIKYNESKIRGKNVIVVDLAYDATTLDFLKQTAKSLIVIDDHPITKSVIGNTKLNNKNYYIGDDKHAACAYTWKFFYPKKKSYSFCSND